jgi:hypothetical protein
MAGLVGGLAWAGGPAAGAAGSLAAALVVCVAYQLGARPVGQLAGGRRAWAVVLAVAGAGIVAAVAWAAYGSGVVADAGGLPQVVRRFTPSPEQRNAYGLRVFLTLAVPAALGAARGAVGRRR